MKRWFHYLFCLMCLVSLQALAQNVKTYIPKQAPALLPTVKDEVSRLMPELVTPWYFGALIEHESCISLTHSRCWNPRSELKTAREQGLGVGQLTRAYNANGSIRFDALQETKDRNRVELKDLSWNTLRDRPDLQVRTMVLMTRGNFNSLYLVKDQEQRLKMSDAAYNGGLGGLNKERKACGLAADCDPGFWDDNIERYCLKSKKALYAGRSACDINRHHVDDVFNNRMSKYKIYF